MEPRVGDVGPGRRRLVWAAIAALLAAGVLGLAASAGLAQPTTCDPSTGCVVLTPTPQPLPGSRFQGGDGNQANGVHHIDWQRLQTAGQVSRTQDKAQHEDGYFTSGSKENEPVDWRLTTGNLGSPQDDFLDIYRAFEHPTGHDAFLYLAFTRRAGTGTTFLTFELNQKVGPNSDGTWTNLRGSQIPCRTTGDVLITFTTHGNEEAVHIDEWVTDPNAVNPGTGCAERGRLEHVTGLRPNVDVQGAFNHDAIDNYLPGYTAVGDSIPARQFGEVAINLTTVLHDTGEPCSDATFISTWAHSRASESETSELKDYVAPQPFVVRPCPASPHLASTTASRVPLGTSIFDTAHLSGGTEPTGTITFRLYGPNNPRCSGGPIFDSRVSVDHGNGPYDSKSFTPRRRGTYRWTVEYSGDANNHGVGPVGCDASETVRVTRAQPEIVTEASGATVLPHPIHDTATLTGGIRPTGTVTFKAFRPTDPGCASAVHTFHVDVHGNDTYTSPHFTPTEAGTWRWTATYSGDGRNAEAGPTACGAPGEEVVVDSPPAPPMGRPGLTTTATATGTAGAPIADIAHLTGGLSQLTGTITFYVYGPNDSTCTGAPAAPPSTVEVSGVGSYTSAAFRPTDPGMYHWRASYSGDATNDPAATACGESGENSVVSTAHPSITTSAAPATAPYGHAVGDTAMLPGGANPRGTITFRLYGPSDASCSRAPAFVAHQEVIGDGRSHSPTFTPTLAGTYRWVATYSGDGRNAAAATRCGDPGESVVVGPPPPIQQKPDEPKPKPKPRPAPKPQPPRFTG